MGARTPLKEMSRVCGEKENYVILRLLSEAGGSSLTYYAKQEPSGQLVVLKELYPLELAEYDFIARAPDGTALMPDCSAAKRAQRWAQYVEMFCREGVKYRLLQTEAADEIVGGGSAVLATDFTFFAGEPFQANGTWYIAVSTGGGACISPANGQTLQDVLVCMTGLCSAIAGLHARGYAHLDVKPDNVFLTSSGQVKLLDLGSMQRADEGEAASSFTPGFTAPGLRSGDEQVSFRADVYSLGAVFFYLLFGRAPLSEDMLRLGKLPGAWAAEAMKGYSRRMMEAVRDVLIQNLDPRPDGRLQDAEALKKACVSLSEQCAAEDFEVSPSENPDEFVRRLSEVGRLEEEFGDQEFAKVYEAQRIEPYLAGLSGEGVFRAVQDAVNQVLYKAGEYKSSLFCLRYLEKRVDLSGLSPYVRRSFYEFLIDCCDKNGNDQLKREYEKYAGTGLVPRLHRAEHDSREALRKTNESEHRFDFDGMLNTERDFIEQAWEEPGRNAVDIILSQEEIDDDLARHAGRLAEALCLSRPESWQEDAGRIFSHVARHLVSNEASFRALSIQNLMNFAVETGDRALFEEAAGLLPKERLLAWRDAADAAQWIQETAERFGGTVADGERYELYLFLKSICALCSPDELTFSHLSSFLRRLSPAGIGDGHPKALILRYAAILSAMLAGCGGPRRTMERIYEKFLRALEETCEGMEQPGIVRMIAEAAWLDAAGRKDDFYRAGVRRRLTDDIRCAIDRGTLTGAYFSDALADESDERLLDLFRFWHR